MSSPDIMASSPASDGNIAFWKTVWKRKWPIVTDVAGVALATWGNAFDNRAATLLFVAATIEPLRVEIQRIRNHYSNPPLNDERTIHEIFTAVKSTQEVQLSPKQRERIRSRRK